jgi:hypothetical protein
MRGASASSLAPAPQVAYDFDFTIAHYNDSLGFTIYELAKQHLVRFPHALGSRALGH